MKIGQIPQVTSLTLADYLYGKQASGPTDIQILISDLLKSVLSPAWTAYTPTVSGSGGDTAPTYSTLGGKYVQIGKLVICQVVALNTSGGTNGSGTHTLLFSTPVTPNQSTLSLSTYPLIVGPMEWYNGGAQNAGACTIDTSGNFNIRKYDTSLMTAGDQNNAVRQVYFSAMYESV